MAKSKSDTANSTQADENAGETVEFETALAELEALVSQMEDGELSLDDSLKAFERGVVLTRQCQAALAAAELKIKVLTEDGELEPFDDTAAE